MITPFEAVTVTAIVSALSTAIVSVGGATITVGQVLAFVVATAGSALLQGLSGGGRGSFGQSSTERQANLSSPVRTRFFGMGGDLKAGGHRTEIRVSSDGDLYRIFVFDCGTSGPIQQHFIANEPVLLDDDGWVQSPAKWQDKLRIRTVYAQDSAPALQEMIDAFPGYWTANHLLTGLSYVMIQQKPVPISVVNGTWPGGANGEEWQSLRTGAQDIIDVRDMSTGYTDNAALCFLYYMTHPYGGQLDLEDFSLASISAAADLCDQIQEGPDGQLEKIYRCAGFFEAAPPGQEVSQVIQTGNSLLKNFNARLFYDVENDGKIGVVVDKPDLNPEGAFTNDAILTAAIADARGLIDQYDSVNAAFVNPNLGYTDDTTPHMPQDLAAPQHTKTIELPFCPSRTQAARISHFEYQLITSDTTLRIGMNGQGVLADPRYLMTFDAIEIDAGDYLIGRRSDGPSDNLTVTLEAVLIPDDFGQFDATTLLPIEKLPAALTAAGETISAPENLCAGGSETAGDVFFAWSPPDEEGLFFEVEWSPEGLGQFRDRQRHFPASDRTTVLTFTSPPDVIDIRARFIKVTGGVTDWVDLPSTNISEPIPAPTAPTIGAPGSVDLQGNASENFNFSGDWTAGECVSIIRAFASLNQSPPTDQAGADVQVAEGDGPISFSSGTKGGGAGDSIFVQIEVENVSGNKTKSSVREVNIVDTGGGA